MRDSGNLYVVQLLQPWESVELVGAPFKASIKGDNEDGCVGFLPVFESLSCAAAWLGERRAAIATIRPVQQEAVPLADRSEA